MCFHYNTSTIGIFAVKCIPSSATVICIADLYIAAFFFHVNLSRDLENNNCFEAETSCVFLGEDPESIDFDPPALEDGSRIDLPVLIMAGNRPQYLFRMLKSLRRVQGLNPDMVTVFIDGFFDEPASVARMFGLRVFEHEGVSKKNSRICQVKLC